MTEEQRNYRQFLYPTEIAIDFSVWRWCLWKAQYKGLQNCLTSNWYFSDARQDLSTQNFFLTAPKGFLIKRNLESLWSSTLKSELKRNKEQTLTARQLIPLNCLSPDSGILRIPCKSSHVSREVLVSTVFLQSRNECNSLQVISRIILGL